MKIALIITTYNWKEALDAVLSSVLKQTFLPDEVIIADDGSRQDTAELIKKYQITFPCPLIHSWQEDDGFRLSASRNKAIALASSEYIVLIDGDMVLDPNFILSHKKNARENHFVQGGRVLTNKSLSLLMLKMAYTPKLFDKGIKNRHNSINSNLLSKIFSKVKNTARSTRGCNMAFWRDDCISINGFNEDFVGWGREDSEFTHRLLNLKLNRLYLKFAGVAYHLHHNEASRELIDDNEKILERTIKEKKTHCKNGISKYL